MVNSTKHQEEEDMKKKKNKQGEGDDDKLFTRIMSKDGSKGNSSCRVYYGSSGAIPFVWESQPGTPKHILADYEYSSSNLPPLTPPPSYYSTSFPISKRYGKKNNINFFLKALIFPAKALIAPKKLNHSPSFSMSSANYSSSSSSSSSSWSSILSSPNLSRSDKFRKLRCFSKLPVRCITYEEDEDEDEDEDEHENCVVRRRDSPQFRSGCYSIGGMKSALLSIVGRHESR